MGTLCPRVHAAAGTCMFRGAARWDVAAVGQGSQRGRQGPFSALPIITLHSCYHLCSSLCWSEPQQCFPPFLGSQVSLPLGALTSLYPFPMSPPHASTWKLTVLQGTSGSLAETQV